MDYVSPLPPVRSGISDYSIDLMEGLEKLCDLRVMVLPGLPVSEEVLSRWPWAEADETGQDGRLPVYQMGNNHYHEEVYQLALRRPGVLTLHDLVLHHFLLDRTLHQADVAGYARGLGTDHGWIGDTAAAVARWDGIGNAAQFSLPVRRSLLRRQRGVLVHSEWAASQIHEEDPEISVAAVPMGIPLPPAADAEAGAGFRERWKIPAQAPLLGSLGFQTPIKRTDSVIAALASEELADVHLLIAGEVSGIMDLEHTARSAGVADRVHITGYLDFDDYQTAIAACDLCLNLRYPTAGETSAALLRVLAVGRPAVVSDYGQFTEMPDDVALKVPLGTGEVRALAVGLGELLADRERLAAMGEASREFIRERHDPRVAAESVVEACSGWAGAEPPGDRPVRIDPPTSLLWGEFQGDVAVEGLEEAWSIGELRRLGIRLENRGFCRWLSAERGDGGVVVRIEFLDLEGDPVGEGSWAALLPDLDPGQHERIEVELRRPSGASRLRIEPHVMGRTGFKAFGGPYFERPI
jgi:glycosyltransferase involved in cell wall biosynthesis